MEKVLFNTFTMIKPRNLPGCDTGQSEGYTTRWPPWLAAALPAQHAHGQPEALGMAGETGEPHASPTFLQTWSGWCRLELTDATVNAEGSGGCAASGAGGRGVGSR